MATRSQGAAGAVVSRHGVYAQLAAALPDALRMHCRAQASHTDWGRFMAPVPLPSDLQADQVRHLLFRVVGLRVGWRGRRQRVVGVQVLKCFSACLWQSRAGQVPSLQGQQAGCRPRWMLWLSPAAHARVACQGVCSGKFVECGIRGVRNAMPSMPHRAANECPSGQACQS